VEIDATDKKVLRSQKIHEMDAAIVAIGENFEATVLASLNLLDFNLPRVIARASGDNQHRILQKIGVKDILLPENEVASNMSERLMNPSITGFLQLPDGFEVAEIRTPALVANRTIEDVGLRDKYSLTLITLKRSYEVEKDGLMINEEHIIGVPKSDQVIYETDTLVVFGMRKDIQKFIEINN
jgi:trk system potassium uptake protein